MGMGEPSQDVGLWDAVNPLLVSVSTDGGHGDPPAIFPLPTHTASRRLDRAFPCSVFLNSFPSAPDPGQQVTSAHTQFGCPSWHPASPASLRCSWKPPGLSPAFLS